jgi:hypothetical protein
MELIVLGLVAGIGFASYALWSRATTVGPAAKREERTPANLQVGDVVQHLGTDFLVEGSLTLAEEEAGGGPGMRLHRLVDGARERYLYVAGGELFLLDEARIPDGELTDSLELDGQHFRRREKLRAMALCSGAMGAQRQGGRVHLRLFAAGATQRLLMLTWSDTRIDAFRGERVSPSLIEILPGK